MGKTYCTWNCGIRYVAAVPLSSVIGFAREHVILAGLEICMVAI